MRQSLTTPHITHALCPDCYDKQFPKLPTKSPTSNQAAACKVNASKNRKKSKHGDNSGFEMVNWDDYVEEAVNVQKSGETRDDPNCGNSKGKAQKSRSCQIQ